MINQTKNELLNLGLTDGDVEVLTDLEDERDTDVIGVYRNVIDFARNNEAFEEFESTNTLPITNYAKLYDTLEEVEEVAREHLFDYSEGLGRDGEIVELETGRVVELAFD